MITKYKLMIAAWLESERASGLVLIFCTVLSLVIANTIFGEGYGQFWNFLLAGESVRHWINDGLMTLFFLVIGLELKTAFISGQFKQPKNALLPVFGALGGMLVPAAVHLAFNYGTPTQSGAGIPMATDAAFALAILSVVGNKVPFALKILLVAIAVVDDLCAIIVIALFYNSGLSLFYLGLALTAFSLLLVLNKIGVRRLTVYVIGGLVMWYFTLLSGVHATISGVLLAIALPFKSTSSTSVAGRIQHFLQFPTNFIILPLFALANTNILLQSDVFSGLVTNNSLGILAGLLVGKPVGVFLACLVAVKIGLGKLSAELNWKHVFGVGILAGIGFTISIFVSMLAFKDEEIVNQSKVAVLFASVLAAGLAFFYLNNLQSTAEIPAGSKDFEDRPSSLP